jgi:hypothetical protein
MRLSPMVPPFTKTKVSTGGQEVTSEDRERETESSCSSVHKDQGEYRRPGGHDGGQRSEAKSSGSSIHKDQGEYRRPGGHVGGLRT